MTRFIVLAKRRKTHPLELREGEVDGRLLGMGSVANKMYGRARTLAEEHDGIAQFWVTTEDGGARKISEWTPEHLR